MSSNALYTDLSGYYDLMCADIDYRQQSHGISRLHTIFGNSGRRHLDLACGTGPHVWHFVDLGYQSRGLDINAPMLDIARARCPQAEFSVQNMCDFALAQPVDLITCFLYSIHYSATLEQLQACIQCVHQALTEQGVFCFNAVDKNTIDNQLSVRHSATHDNNYFEFESCWNYAGAGDAQALQLRISKTTAGVTQTWQDAHAMVAVSFEQLRQLLLPYFEVHILEHDYSAVLPWLSVSGNAIFVCIKR